VLVFSPHSDADRLGLAEYYAMEAYRILKP
jgi:hypothetical protein